MSNGLYIGATLPYAGKSMLSIGIGLRLLRDGINFGYMKPVGDTPPVQESNIRDDDASFICDVLQIDDPADLITPVQLTQDFKMRAFTGTTTDEMPTIKKAFDTLKATRDTMLVSGAGDYYSAKYCGLDSTRIIKELNLKGLIIDKIEGNAHYDSLLAIKEQLGDSMAGVILNDVPPELVPEIETVTKPFFERKGIPVFGIIQSDPFMRSIRVADLAEHLGGKLITAQNNADRMVENFLIGTMQVENFMTYFRRQPNAAVIVGGDRADVQLVAIEGECPCIILTGNLYPNDIILSRADTLKVPIIIVRGDTYFVAHRMEALLSRYKMRDTKKVSQAGQLVERAVDFHALYKELGLHP